MKKELQKELREGDWHRAEMFKDKDGNYIDIKCGDGWFHILDIALLMLGNHQKIVGQLRITEIKQRYGKLCIYLEAGDYITETILEFARKMSHRVCETCGKPSKIVAVNDKLTCTCDDCLLESRKRQAKICRSKNNDDPIRPFTKGGG